MAEAARDALLERTRVIAFGEKVEIVIALEHGRGGAAQARFDERRGPADVGEHAEAECTVADYELHGLPRVVRHRERPHLEIADRESIVAVEAVDLRDAVKA